MRLRSLVQVVAIAAICGAAGTTDRPHVSAAADPPQPAPLQVAAADPTAEVAPAVTVLPAVPGTAAVAYATGDAGAPSATPTSALANNEPLPACGTGDTLTPLSRLSDWGLTLVDSTYAVS
ncbi:MAG: hypothetical protein ABSB75_03315, partial [Candidatus Limnocylindrales bacterium]